MWIGWFQDGCGPEEPASRIQRPVLHGLWECPLPDSRAIRTDSEELKFMIEVAEPRFLPDLILKLMDRAGGGDRLDAAATGANQIIAVLSRNQQCEIGGSLMQAQAPDHTMLGESLEQAENSGLVALVGKPLGGGEFGKGHRALAFQQGAEQLLQRFGAAQSGASAAGDGFLDDGIHGGNVTGGEI